jgi:hypothetical protein|tara:strand:+ start:5063 stop:5263 length:201 start_codon:yes stop_codon:yes gene_type:complete
MKKYKSIIFILVAIALLYLAKDKYSSFNVSKSIQACLMGQKKLNPDLTKEEAEKICVEYVNEQVNK